MEDKASAPPPYPGTGPGSDYGGQYNTSNPTNYPPPYSNQGYQGYQGGQSFPAQPQPITYPPSAYGQQQQMMNNTVVVGGYGNPGAYQTVPQDYSTQAWIACLCCFWPTGILAIMKASESRDALSRGDLVAANVAANSARQMVKISYIVGIISIIFVGVIFGVYFGVIMGMYNNNDY